MKAAGLAPAAEGGIAEELLRRPEIDYPLVAGIIGWGEEITPMLAERLDRDQVCGLHCPAGPDDPGRGPARKDPDPGRL